MWFFLELRWTDPLRLSDTFFHWGDLLFRKILQPMSDLTINFILKSWSHFYSMKSVQTHKFMIYLPPPFSSSPYLFNFVIQISQHPGWLQGGLLLAEAEHGRGCPGDVLVGLRLPDSRHGQQNHAGRQQHMEQQSHSTGESCCALYHGLGEYSVLIGWRVSVNFWYTDTCGTP